MPGSSVRFATATTGRRAWAGTVTAGTTTASAASAARNSARRRPGRDAGKGERKRDDNSV
jgi:hypothetical protein